MKAAPGIAGGIGGWLITGDGLTSLGIALVATVACLFGMVSSASRVKDARGKKAARLLLMNAGAVCIAAMALAVSINSGLATSALVGLGVGLAGTKVLEVIEAGAITAAQRFTGKELVTKDELADLLGDVRQDAQAALSEVRVVKPPRARRKRQGEGDAAD